MDSVMQAAGKLEADTFVVHVHRDRNGSERVNSIELLAQNVRNRYSFHDDRTLTGVLQEDVAAAFQEAIDGIKDDESVLVLPDFILDIPGLVLSGLRVLKTHGEDGVEFIMLRVRQFIGSIKSLFLFEPSMGVESLTMREKIAVDVLDDILTPLTDILSLHSHKSASNLSGYEERVTHRLNKIDSRIEELSFYVGLLKRYVAGCRYDSEHQIEASGQDGKSEIRSAG